MQGTPSKTAWSVAQRRAVHQALDRPLVFEDPLAARIVGGRWKPAKEAEPAALSGPFRAFVAGRSRYAEDALAAAYERGVRQYVLLGAGLDTFAYRNRWPDLKVFEVDHPATQAWKFELLERAGIGRDAVYVPVDFEHQNLAARLCESGFEAAPAFFAWLGVTQYLTREAFDATAEFVASLPAPSGLVFDYAILPELMNAAQRKVYQGLAAKVARAGEPFRLAWHPERLAEYLRGLGFSFLEDLDGAGLDARYFAGRADGLTPKQASARLLWAFRPEPTAPKD